ncbi:MAG: Fic family protein [Clostridiales bacterium]|nr:Fic family protein [Clostridiales bacterium]
MSKYDIYLQDGSKVLKNKLGITDETALDKTESIMVSTKMALLYNSGFSDFSSKGVCKLHKTLFGDVYDWAGQYRIINIQKKEKILAGKSVWYSNWDTIDKNLHTAWDRIDAVNWSNLTQEEFAHSITHLFSAIWQIHPFREGNTRTTVLLIALFVEHHGYYFDYELMASSAGYVRNAFVLCCFGENSEFEHLEKILLDAISIEPIEDSEDDEIESETKSSKYEKYYTKDYKPTPHEYIENN